MRQALNRLGRLLAPLPRRRLLWLLAACAVAAGAALALHEPRGTIRDAEVSSQSKRAPTRYRPTEAEWANLVVEAVEHRSFRPQQLTEGKIAAADGRSTPVFAPYSGRVRKLLVKAGDRVEKGQLLYVIEATDTVQALNELMAAAQSLAKARAAFAWAEISEQRSHALYDGKAVPLRDVQQAQSDLTAAQNDARAAEAALAAARQRLHSFGRSDAEIAAFEESGRISAETPVYAPISGTIIQRKVGPGQLVSASAGDPVFVVGDLSTVWLTIFVRETEAPKVRLGQDVTFTVAALPDRVFTGRIDYAASALDPATHRMLVRASVPNDQGLLKPEMLASVTIMAADESRTAAVPQTAVVHDGGTPRVWIAHEDKTIELRRVTTGLASGGLIQVLDGLGPGDRVITKGSLFFDRPPAGS